MLDLLQFQGTIIGVNPGLVTIPIPTPPAAACALELEDGTGRLLLEDGSGVLLLESCAEPD